MPVAQKRPYDERIISVNLGPVMRAEDRVGSIISIVPDGSDLTVSDIRHSSGVVSFLTEGGTSQQVYTIMIRFMTSGANDMRNQLLETFIRIQVL